MQIVIDLPEKIYKRIAVTPRCASTFDAIEDRDAFVKAVQKGTVLPKGATNGEIIQSLFLNIDKVFSNVIDLNLWWNAKYKAESGDKE